MYVIKVNENLKTIDNLDVPFNVDFYGSLMVMIDLIDNEYKVINAMNGYGDNCMNEYSDAKVTIFESIPVERVVKPTLAGDVRIIYKNGKPYGIRDKGGYLFFFTQPTQYTGQDKRYQEEMEQLQILAEYLLNKLSKCPL